MAAIRSKNTKPEMIVRRITHKLGYRYVLHKRKLPGHPDLVFPSRLKVIFVHGCFWHMHRCRYGRVTPASNAAFWTAKRSVNIARDARNLRTLRRLGWRVLVVWECETRKPEKIAERIQKFLTTD